MNPDQINAAYTALSTAVQDATNKGSAQIANNSAALAPALAVGANSYDMGRYVTPVTAAVADKLVIAAKQNLLKKVLTDASQASQTAYTDANDNYQTRQRQYYRDLAIAAAARQAKADALTDAQTKIANANNNPGAVIVNKAAPIINNSAPVSTPSPALQPSSSLNFLLPQGGLSVNSRTGSGKLKVQ